MSRLYRTLLRLYPASFREEYAPEMVRAFETETRDFGVLRTALYAMRDALPNAMSAHLNILGHDLRYTARTLSRSKGFAIATILVTALGVGANTATFSVADFVLLRPLPFPHAEELVRLCEGPRIPAGWGCMNQFSPDNYRDAKARARSFAQFGVYTGASMNLVGAGEPIRVSAISVTSEVLPLLGVKPLIGRFFDQDKNPADQNTAAIGYGLWQTQFGGDPSIVGKSVSLDGTPYTVIAVMPQQFRWPGEGVQLWTPLVLRPADFNNRNNSYLDGIARLKPGVSFETARAELSGLADRMTAEFGKDMDEGEFGFSFYRLRDEMAPRYKIMLLGLCGASLCLLLLTCANLANLLLVRSASRERELAVRAALGAGRERLMRQMLTESLLLALLGGVAGLLLAYASVPLLAQLVPTSLPIATHPTLDVRAFGIAAVLSVVTGLAFGLIPAMRVGGRTGLAALREGTRGSGRRQRLRMVLVALEVTVSVILLVASGLLIRAVWRVQNVNPGFDSANVLTMETSLPFPKYDDPAFRNAFYDRVLAEVRTLPGVESAAYVSGLPMVMWGGITRVNIQGREIPKSQQWSAIRVATPQLFSTMRIPFIRGRDFGPGDSPEARSVAIVSESFANTYWPNTDPIGQPFQTRGLPWTVVGVVGDMKFRGLERPSEPQMYVPSPQADALRGIYTPKILVVRSAHATQLITPIRDIIRRVDPQQPVSNVRMLSTVLGNQTEARRSQLRILLALAALALVLAAVGIHGLLAFTVAQRDREIGVRLALGADPGAVARMVVGEGVKLALIGVVPGIAIAYLAARSMQALLFGVPAADPITFSAVAAVCFGTVVLACLRPAWRASRIEPIAALKAD